SGGRCARRRGKCRIMTLTSSLLHSQNDANSSRSSSGVSKSDEKMVVGTTETAESSGAAGWRFRRRAFITVFPFVKLSLGPTLQRRVWTAGNLSPTVEPRRRQG